MKREIEFKAKRNDNGKWVCGLLAPIFSFKDGIVFKICEVYKDSEGNLTGFEVFEVEQETISQFTGLYDKHGNKIFEDDLLVSPDREYDDPLKVVWSEYNIDELEIIGNIHDNPELLEGKE